MGKKIDKIGYKETKIGLIPEGWITSDIDSILSIKSGFGFKFSEYVNSGIRLLRIDNVSYGKIEWDTVAYLPKDYLKKHHDLVLNEGDIVLALNRPITQKKLKIAIIEKEDSPSILYQRVGKLVINSNVYSKYIFYTCQKYIYNYVQDKAIGSDQPFISTIELGKLIIPLPPLPEQKKIAEILSTWDRAIEKTEKLIDAKTKLKKGLMQQLLTGRKRFKEFSTGLDEGGNHETHEIHEKGIPEDWRFIVLKKFLTPALKPVSKPEQSYNALGIRSHGKGTFVRCVEDHSQVMMDTLYEVREDDLIVNITFAWEGAIAIVKKKDEGNLVSHRFPTYVFNKNKVIPEFFKYVIVTKHFIDMLGFISPGGAGRNRVLNKNDFLKLKVKIPENIKEQQRIASVLSSIDNEISVLNKKLEAVKLQKKGLIQKLLTGQVRVRVCEA